jgi:alkylation response protein AidB-like acyl-CoA dehydrogenase
MTADIALDVTQVHERIAELAPAIAARAAEVEAARRVPRDLLDDLVKAGCFRLLLPRSHGGIEAGLPAALRAFEAIARADASVGWIAMLGATLWIDLAALPGPTFDSIFAAGPDVFVSGVISPMRARAAKVDGGYRVSGRWSFASGCEHARWLYGNCVEDPETRSMRLVLLAPEQVTIEDTWRTLGLAGTGSHDFTADDVLVPAERTYQLFADEPSLGARILRIPVPALLACEIASVALGAAQGALDDVTEIARSKVPLLASGPLAGSSLFQHQIGTADVKLRAARSLLHAEAEEAMAAAEAGAPFPLDRRARLRSAATWAVTTAAAVVDTAFTAAGGSAIYASHPLQRRLRDVHALTQHFLVKLDTLTASGAVLAGAEPELAMF